MDNQLVLPLFKRHSTKPWVYIDECNNVTTWADYFTSGSLTCERSADKQRKYVAGIALYGEDTLIVYR